MRIDEYSVNLESHNFSLNYSKISSSFRKFRTPDRIEITITEKRPEIDDKTLQKIKIIKMLLEKLTGKKLKIFIPKDTYEIQVNYTKGQDVIEFEKEEENLNVKYSNFSAQGFVKTKDGRTIEFSVAFKNVQLSYSYEKISGKTVDPLVIDLRRNGIAENLVDNLITDITTNNNDSLRKVVELDLNFDGKREKFYLTNDFGFLVYDKNSNGRVDDATELFGPKTNNGFAELSKLDSDHDNWIDEDDLEFLKLKIWTVGENGREKLVGLLDLNVGAIFLGNVTTPFDYKDYVVRNSGIYLREDGGVGIIRQIDVKV
ncbi:MAG: hypothetical protein ACK4R7_02180 [Fervidobacterium sp.]